MTVPNDVSRSLIAWSGALMLHLVAGAAVYLTIMSPGGRTAIPAAGRDGVVRLRLIAPMPSSDPPTTFQPSPPLAPVVRAPLGVSSVVAGREAPATDNADGGAAPMPPTVSQAAFDAAQAQFLDVIAAYIERHRVRSAIAGRDGVVWLRIVMRRDGRIMRSWIDHGSGDPLLDDEGLAAVRTAQPLPPIPVALPDTIDLTVPIAFGQQP